MTRYEVIDVHSHILPGIDDGAQDMKMSQQMLRKAAKDGIRQVILTPHYVSGRTSADKETVEELVHKLQDWLMVEKIPIELYTGHEVYYRHGMSNLLREQKCCTLADSFYVLVEFSPREDYDIMRNGLQELLQAGYYPILAHVERYRAVTRKRENLEDLVDMGVYLQINANTLIGKHGHRKKRKAIKWIKKGYIQFVASDAHNMKGRKPTLAKSIRVVQKKAGKAIALELFEINPKRILQNKAI